MSTTATREALVKGAAGERVSREEALSLVAEACPDSLQALGEAAHANRVARFGRRATFVFNLQINPSNVCSGGCRFCRFAVRSMADARAYSLDERQILGTIARLVPVEVHITGGLNDLWPYARCLDLVRSIRQAHPRVHIKAFDAVEIHHFAATTGMTTQQVLESLVEAGLDALPGGGAEIFSLRLRRRHWPRKISPRTWLSIHEQAHRLGVPTNATMLFGLDDTWPERVEHMLRLRQSQDRAPGYECFVPLAFQPGEERFVSHGPTPFVTLQVLALARIVLDNIPHLKSYWPASGEAVAAAGLGYGADDMDGTLREEKIMHSAGSPTPTGFARQRMVEMISLAGFDPVERDGAFNLRPQQASREPDRAPARPRERDCASGGHTRSRRNRAKPQP